MNLKKDLFELRGSSVKDVVEGRLDEFKKDKDWFSELCFCILTANSKAQTAIQIQNALGVKGFSVLPAKDIRNAIIENKHRFHNNKTKYIIEARKFVDVKSRLLGLDVLSAREWLVENVKGIGYKEASHFLRNVGYDGVAILDRHILSLLSENKLIEMPSNLNKKNYLDIEKKFISFSKEVGMKPSELDLYMWFMRTGKVLK